MATNGDVSKYKVVDIQTAEPVVREQPGWDAIEVVDMKPTAHVGSTTLGGDGVSQGSSRPDNAFTPARNTKPVKR